MTAPRPSAGLALPPPLSDVSADGLRAAVEADSIGSRVVLTELPVIAHRDADADWAVALFPDPFRSVVVSARFTEATADRRIAEIVAANDALPTGFVWWLAPFHTPPDLLERLVRAGLIDYGPAPAMAMDLARLPDDHPLPPGLAIEPVRDEAGLRTYLGLLARDEGPEGAPPNLPPHTVEAIVANVAPTIDLEPVPFHYVGRLGGRPVATARLSLAGGAAGVYAIYTTADARGRGIGSAMTWEALRRARAAGYRVATLQSSEAGFNVYRRLGFEVVFEYRFLVHLPAA